MLIATAVEGNNQIFLLAFAVVDQENTKSWRWFLTCIRHYVTRRQGICLISDRHASIKAAMGNDNPWWRPPYAYHVYCLRHVISNFNKAINDAKLKKMATRAGMQRQIRKFDRDMRRIEELSPTAADWLKKISVEKWTAAHDGGRRYDIMTTNLSECFNDVLKNARFLPITALVQLTFFRLVTYFEQRRTWTEGAIGRGEKFTPHVVGLMSQRRSRASSHQVTGYNTATRLFQVQTAPHGPYMSKGNNVQVCPYVLICL